MEDYLADQEDGMNKLLTFRKNWMGEVRVEEGINPPRTSSALNPEF
jgi:hypothetical protein